MSYKKNLSRNVALCYVRQSRTMNKDDMTSPERQVDLAHEECEKYGWEAEIYMDADGHKSGQDEKNRPEWLRLKKRLQDPDVVALVAYDASRLHRKMWRVGETMELCKRYGVKVVFIAPYMQWLNSQPDNAFLFFQSLKDEMEAKQTAEKVKHTIAYHKSRGRTWARPPFGTIRVNGYLQPSPNGAWLLPNGQWVAGNNLKNPPQEDALWRGYFDCLKLIMETYAKGFYSMESITDMLQKSGWAYCNRAYEPVAFEVADVRRIIANWQQYGGLPSAGRSKEEHAKSVILDEVELNAERAVLDVDLLYRVGMVRRDRSRLKKDKGVKKADFHYPLAGLIYCAHCERLATQQNNPKLRSRLGGKSQKMYRHKAGASCGCGQKSVMRHEIEADFLRLVELLDVKEEYLPLLAQWAIELNEESPIQDESDFEQKKAEAIAICQRRIDATIHLYGEGRLSRADYEQRIEQSERELSLWKTRTSDKQKITIELTKVKELISQTAFLWHNSSDEDKHGLAETLFDYIIYDLDAKQIVGYKLKAWAERYMILRGGMYEDYNTEDYKGTNVTPTRFELVYSP